LNEAYSRAILSDLSEKEQNLHSRFNRYLIVT